jgi:hypothetical protein
MRPGRGMVSRPTFLKENKMLLVVQVCFPGSAKRYSYLSRDPANIGDFAVVDSPVSGIISLPIVGTDETLYSGATKYVERIITAAAALSSTKAPVPMDWKTEKFTLLHESGALVSGQRWHDTEESATKLARDILQENFQENRRRNGKIIVCKALTVIGIEEPVIEIKAVGTKKKRKARK